MVLCQGAAGAENHILLRVFGADGHIEWRHAAHNELRLAPLEGFPMTLSRGHPLLSAAATRATRFRRTGHPEGLHEAFANLYREAAEAIHARNAGAPLTQLSFPTIDDGVESMGFIEACIASHQRQGVWTPL